MATVEIEVGEELGRFTSKQQWVSHAERIYGEARSKFGSRDMITLDSAIPRRVMLRGLQFNQADVDCTYPAVIYAIKTQ